MTSAGDLEHRIGFFQRPTVSDDHGNTVGEFPTDPAFECRAEIRVKFGGEAIHAEQLRGHQVATITVRRSREAAAVTPSWQIVDMRDRMVWSIRSGPVDPDDRRRWLEFLCRSEGTLEVAIPPDTTPPTVENSLDFSSAENSGYLILLEDI